MPKLPRAWRKTLKRRGRACGRGGWGTWFSGLFSDPFGDEMRIVSILDRSRSYGVVHEGFGGQVIRRPVHVRYGRGVHRVLVRRRIIMERVGGQLGRRRVFLDGKVRSVSASSSCLDVAHGYRHAVIPGLGRKEFGRSGRVTEAVGIVFPLVEYDLLPRVRHEVLIRKRTAYRYRRLQRGCRFRIERRQIGDDLVPFGRRQRGSRRSRLYGDDVRQRGERYRERGDRRGENRSRYGGTFRGIQN